jgi:uncharacterized protein with FMN-binding domain
LSTIRKPSASSTRTSKPGQRVSKGLVALSSAVVSVYSAGYLRTQAAAERFEAESGQRRPIVPAPAPAVAEASEAAPPTIGAPMATPPAAEAPPSTTARAVVAAKAAPAVVAPAAAVPPATKDVEPSAAPPMSATSVTRPAAPAPAAVAPIAASPQGAANTTAPVAPPAAAAAPAPVAVPAGPRYKDGTYTGWGTSRHGDIEAQVVIVNGRITSATIAQCWTRWPCSWIEALPGQVVARQSPETDFVSGATQSTNAFYYAVVQALGKAALP